MENVKTLLHPQIGKLYVTKTKYILEKKSSWRCYAHGDRLLGSWGQFVLVPKEGAVMIYLGTSSEEKDICLFLYGDKIVRWSFNPSFLASSMREHKE